MRLDRFDLNLLVTLDALLRERSVTRAAERVHVGQSAASAALNRLRDHFGDDLLTMVGREMVLTPLARSLIIPVREALLHARAAVSLRSGFEPASMPMDFSLRASEYVTQVCLPPLVRRLSGLAPRLQLRLQGMAPDMFDLFERGANDFLILPERYARRIEHPKQVLFEEDHVGIAWRDHPTLQGRMTLEQYLETGQVAVNRYLPGGEAFEDWLLGGLPRRPRTEVRVESLMAIPGLVVGTPRVAHLQRRLAQQVVQGLPLQILELPVELPTVVEVLCWPRHLDDDPRHQWMRSVIVDVANELDMRPPGD